jgi:hypothetical protein
MAGNQRIKLMFLSMQERRNVLWEVPWNDLKNGSPLGLELGWCYKYAPKGNPYTGLDRPLGSRRLRLPELLNNRHRRMEILLVQHTGRLYALKNLKKSIRISCQKFGIRAGIWRPMSRIQHYCRHKRLAERVSWSWKRKIKSRHSGWVRDYPEIIFC